MDMDEKFSRTEMLIGNEGMKKLNDAKVAVFGIGGVGSFVCEGLARSGLGNLILVDFDKIDESNINRQLIATVKTVTAYVKTEANQDADVLGYLAMGDQVLVLEESEEWCKVSIEEGDGYVLTDLVRLHSEFVTAESKEEEAARLAEEAKKREEARKAARLAAEKEAAERLAALGDVEPSEIGIEIANYACQFVGNPYKWGGTSLTEGADCSGFVLSVYANFGVELPHSSSADRNVGYGVGSLAEAIPGDIFCYSGHVAIYIGDGQIVHASTSKTGIIISKADYRTILCIRRIF